MRAGTRIPTRPLLVLATAVLAAHLLLLRSTPVPMQVPDAVATRPFNTRSIIAAPPAPAPVAAPKAAAVPVAPARTKPAAPEATQSQPAAPQPQQRRPAGTATEIAKAPPPIEAGATAPQPAAPSATTPPPLAPPPPAGGSRGPALAFAIPGSARLHYQVNLQKGFLSVQGKGELLWQHDAGSYDARLQVSGPMYNRTQRSTGDITREGLAPSRFSDRARSEEAAHFVRDKGKLSFSSNRPETDLMAGAQDRLSVMFQLGAMIGGEPRKFPPGTIIAVQTASTREAEIWHFTVEGEDQLKLPGGAVSAIRLTRNPRHEYDQKVELWLAPRMDYVPVRLRLTNANGDSVDQQWSSTDRG